jgi:hypothetical protein
MRTHRIRTRAKFRRTVSISNIVTVLLKRTTTFGVLCALSILCGMRSAVTARDLNILMRISYAAFVADDGAAICSASRLNFSTEDQAVFQDAKGYAQWIKQRVSEGLSADDVSPLLISAADRAKSEIHEAITALKSDAEVFQWCTAHVAPMVRDVVGVYVRNRDLMDEIIEKAKQD